MVFWKSHTKSILESPTGFPSEYDLTVTDFLHAHFRIHPDVVYHPSFKEDDIILTVRDTEKLVGCIRYRCIDIEKQIHLVDCFCIHPEWRGKGVGDYLLHDLHHRMKDKPYAIFLKEGAPLPIPSYYTSMYVYRHILKQTVSNVSDISISLAYQLMEIYGQFRPFFKIARPSSNQQWRLYKNEHHNILACVQDTYQTLHEKKMGWITAWIESPGITDTIREDASYQLSQVNEFDMIWMDWNWITKYPTKYPTNDTKYPITWTIDGPFHWYTYQWTPELSIDRSYCFIH
jgi:GNAT superfamily N-acetyltransferase